MLRIIKHFHSLQNYDQKRRYHHILLTIIFHRNVCSRRTSLTLPSMFTGLAFLESPAVMAAANAGISLSMVLNVQALCQLTVLCTWGKQAVKIFTASTILRGTATTSTKARCAWHSGSLIVPDTVEVITPTQAIIPCRGSSLKKFQNLRPRSRDKTRPFLHKRFQCDGNKRLVLITGGFSDFGCALYFFLHVADVK